LRSLLGGESAASPGSAMARFETTVGKLVQTHGKAVLGRLHFLNLEELITRRGPGQKTRLKKAENVFLAVIGKNLKEGETYVRPNVSSVFFLFPSLTRAAGELKCAAIADQIARALVEEDPVFTDLKSESSAQTVGAKTWSGPRAARRPSVILSGDAKGVKGPAAPPEHSQPRTAGGGARRDILPSPSAESADRRLEGVQAVYQAIWNVRSKMITSYAAFPLRRHPDGTVRAGKSILGADAGFALMAALDSFMLRKSVNWLHGLMNVRQQTLLVLPVHFTTVDNQTLLRSYRQDLAALSQDERKYVVLEILGAPDTLPAFRVKEVIARLRPSVRCVLVRLPTDTVSIRHWAEGGALGVGVSAGDEKLSEKQLMERMDAFVAQAEKASVHAYVHDLATASLVTAAVAAGFRYVGGAAILPESEVPNPIEAFECQNIFARVIGA
jgi:hypothetical protein